MTAVADALPAAEYVAHRFDAVNQTVDHLAAEHRSLIAQRRAATRAIYMKWAAALLLAAGIVAALVIAALALWREPQVVERIVERPVVTEKLVTLQPIVNVTTPAPEPAPPWPTRAPEPLPPSAGPDPLPIEVGEAPIEVPPSGEQPAPAPAPPESVAGAEERVPAEALRSRAQDQLRALIGGSSSQPASPSTDKARQAAVPLPVSRPSPPAREVYNFVIFRKTPFGRDGFGQVIVGMQYASAEAKKPDSQWCYVQRPKGDGNRDHVQLVTWSDGQAIEAPLTQRLAESLGTTVAVLEDARSRCRFE